MHDSSKITTLARGLHEWVERPANERFLVHEQEAILAGIAPGRATPQAPVAAWLLGTFRLARGFARVLRGDGRGFDEARLGQALRRCSLLLRLRDGTAGRDLPFSLPQASLCALLGLALDDPAAEPLHDALRGLPDRRFGPGDELCLFTRELLRLAAGQRCTITAGLGAYAEILTHWDAGGHHFAQRLADALELHLQQVGGKVATFEDPPCRLYPVEVFAVRGVRLFCELPMPKVEHALMFTNLATMPVQGPWPADSLTAKLERACGLR